MKHSKRILAYSAFALIVMLAAVAGIAPAASSVALAQTVPAAPDVTATSPTDTSITLSWDAVSTAVSYEVRAYDEVDGHRTLSDVSAPMTTITDSNLVTGRAYFYWVSAVNSDGGQGPWSARVDLVAGGAPDTPANLAGTAGLLQNSLTWDAVANADHYEVWGRLSTEANNYRELDLNQASNSYTHTGLTAGQSWYYWVRAVDGNGTKGLYAGPEVLTVLTPTPVGAPPSFTATMGNTEITITWGDSPDMTGVTITGYEYRYAASGEALPATWAEDAGAEKTETITGLTNGTAYNFEVRATSSVGPGTAATASATPSTVPGVPTSFAASSTNEIVTLSWGAPSDNGGAQVTSYRLEVLNDQNQWVTLATRNTSQTGYTHRNLERSTEYQYRIHASNVAGEGSAASISIFTLDHAPEKPSAPSGFGAEPGPGKVDLDWDAPDYTGGSAITAYYYRYKVGTGSYRENWQSVGLETEVEVTGLTPGEMYTFQVISENGVGRSDPPAESEEVTVTNTVPTAAPVIRVTLEETLTVGGDDQIRINWDALSTTVDGNGDDTTASIINTYTLHWKSSRYPDGGTDTTDWPDDDAQTADDQVQEIPAAATHSVLFNEITGGTPLLPGTTYTFRVRADNPVGGGEWSDEEPSPTPANIPTAPSAGTDESVAAEGVDATSIKIEWVKPADNGGATISSYEIQWKTHDPNDGGDDDFADTDSIIKNLSASRVEYTHRGVRTGQSYFYRVRAVNSAGEGAWSVSSNSVTTETAAQGTPGAPGTPAFTDLSQTAGSVTVGWEIPTDQGDLPISSYELQYQITTDTDDDTTDADDWSDAVSVQPTPPTANSYPHANAAGAETYRYRVRAVNGKGAGDWSATNDQIFDARGPNTPVLSATATGTSDILVAWNVPEGNGTVIDNFVLQSWLDITPNNTDDPEWVPLDFDPETANTQNAPATQTAYTHSDLDAGTEYFYRIRTDSEGDGGDADSVWSQSPVDDDSTANAVSATTLTGVPGRPTIATSVPGDGDDDGDAADDIGKITLTWTAPDNTGGSDITGYEIEILNVSTRTWVAEASVADDVLTYTDEELEPGKTYYYILRAVTALGNSAWTPYVTVTSGVGLPEAPVLSATALGRNSVMLTWTVPDDRGTPIVGYQIEQWDGSDWGTDVTGRGDDDTDNVTTETVGSLEAGTEYFYRIRALVAEGTEEGAWSATDDDSTAGATSVTTMGDVPPAPTAPMADAQADPNIGDIEVSWTAPDAAALNGLEVTGYSVQRYNSDTSMWDEIATPTASPYTDPDLARGKTYYYRVASVNDQGTGAYTTSFASASIVVAAPDGPVLTATATGPYAIQLSWTIPADNGTTIAGFLIEKWVDITPTDNLTNPVWVNITTNTATAVDPDANTTATQTLYIDDNLAPNTRYDYQIRAIAATGTDSTIVLANATTHIGAPGRPQDVTATAEGENAIKLEWKAPASNGGSPIDRYEIWMWDTTAKAWGWNGVAGDVHTVSHPSTSFTHSGLDAGTQNLYRVRAVNDATNDNGGVGKWSTIVTAKTDEADE